MSSTNGTTKKLRKFTRNPTRAYQPGGNAFFGYASSVIDLAPFFTWFDVPRMLRDPRVRFTERMWRAPFQRVKWKVRASSRQVAKFVGTTLRRFWRGSLPKILSRYFRYGYAPGGAEFIAKRGAVRLDRVRSIEPTDAQPLMWRTGPDAGQPAGFRLSRGGLYGALGAAHQFPADGAWVGAPHAFWFAGYGELSPWYDMPPLAGMFEPWLEKRGRNGAIHIRRGWFRKCAYRGGVLHHPEGTTNMGTDESPSVMDNQDIARSTLEYSETGAVYTFTNEVNPAENGKYAWDFEEPEAQPDVKGVREYPQDLDREMLEGAGIPPEVLEAADVGSGWSGRLIPLMGFLGGVDELAGLLIEAADMGWLKHLVAVNFGPSAWYEIEPLSLAEEVQAQAKSGKGGSEGANPVPDLFGRDQQGKGQDKQSVSLSSTRSGLTLEEVKPGIHRWVRDGSGEHAEYHPETGEHATAAAKRGTVGEPPIAAIVGKVVDTAIRTTRDVASSKVIEKLGKAGQWLIDRTKAAFTKLESRYGRAGAIAIAASSQALSWGAFLGGPALVGIPVYIPSAVAAAPGAAIAEALKFLKKARSVEMSSRGRLSKKTIRRESRKLVEELTTAWHATVQQSHGTPVEMSATDPDATGRQLMRYRKVDLVHGILAAMFQAQEEATAKGKPEDAAPAINHLGQLLEDPEAAGDVLDGEEMSWSAYTGERGGKGWKNDETGKVIYGGEKPGERKERLEASRGKATEILRRIRGTGDVSAEDVKTLAEHLPSMTVAQLRLHREAMMARLGGKGVKANYVKALLEHARKATERALPSASPVPSPEVTPPLATPPETTPEPAVPPVAAKAPPSAPTPPADSAPTPTPAAASKHDALMALHARSKDPSLSSQSMMNQTRSIIGSMSNAEVKDSLQKLGYKDMTVSMNMLRMKLRDAVISGRSMFDRAHDAAHHPDWAVPHTAAELKAGEITPEQAESLIRDSLHHTNLGDKELLGVARGAGVDPSLLTEAEKVPGSMVLHKKSRELRKQIEDATHTALMAKVGELAKPSASPAAKPTKEPSPATPRAEIPAGHTVAHEIGEGVVTAKAPAAAKPTATTKPATKSPAHAAYQGATPKARDALDAALHNANGSPKPANVHKHKDQRDLSTQLASAWDQLHRDPAATPDDFASMEKAITEMVPGIAKVGEHGEEVAFDPSNHLSKSSGIFTGDRAKVKVPGWRLPQGDKQHTALKAEVEKT